MAILITGGAGFLGQHLAKRLLEAEKEVVILDLDIEKAKDKIKGVILVQGDVSNIADIESLCEKYQFTTVFHLAAMLPPMTEEDPYRAFKVNVEGTLNILNSAQKHGIETVIYPSSATVFGPDRRPPFTEEDLMDPWTIYSSFKICTEIIGSIYSKKFPLNFRAVRFPVIVGPGRSPFLGVTKYPTQMVEEAVKGRPYIADVSPETSVPIIYIEDAIQILINLWRSKEIHFEIVNVDGIWVTAQEIADGIKKFIPAAEITFKPVENVHIQQVLEGVKKHQEDGKHTFRGKRLLDEILSEYISREQEK
ncbi:MAG TPA: NAD-dependent epimerase/dehydratase family protein [Candidatus Bathyarchaeia archaeon]|nr:NAD-dependent epimerase/dehydratase family protein [Candidatus Bathyarchaeia archaeon]